MHFRYSSKILSHRPQSPNVGLISIFTCPNLPATLDIKSIPVRQSPRAHLHVVGMFAVCEFDINQPSLPTPFYSVLVSVSVSMALSTVFHSINSPDNSPFSHSVLPVSFMPYWSFQLYIYMYVFMRVSLSPDVFFLWLTGLKAPTN